MAGFWDTAGNNKDGHALCFKFNQRSKQMNKAALGAGKYDEDSERGDVIEGGREHGGS